MKTSITSIVISIIALLLTLQTTTAQCHIEDWTALKALYDSADGDNWGNRDGWDVMIADQNSPPTNCNLRDLRGVELNLEERVESLNLRISGLSGIIPPELGNLTNLTFLDFGLNDLTGTIPPELGNLTNLNELDFWNNDLTGTIPPELGNLTNLEILYLHSNELTGTIPPELGNLTNLTLLDFWSNELTGTIPPELGNLTNLSSLDLSTNELAGTIPPELGNLTNLSSLDFGFNELTGTIPPELGNLTNLTFLNFGFNELTGTIPPELGNLTNLTFLSLNHNQLTGIIPPELGNLTNLQLLYLHDNKLLGCYPNSLTVFCDRFGRNISAGNNFDATYENFCAINDGACAPVSTSTYHLNNEINLHYNYLSNSLNITSSNLPVENIAIYNTNGQLLKKHNINISSNVDIDVSYLAKGLYVVVASINNDLFRTKFIVT